MTLVFETSLDGHRRHYLSVIDEAIASQGGDWVFYLPVEGTIDLKHGAVLQEIGAHASKGIGSAMARLRNLLEAAVKCRPRRILIPTGDGLSQFLFLLSPLLIFLGCRIVCVLHRAKFGYPARSLRDRLIQVVSYIGYRLAFRCSFLSVDIVPVEALRNGWNPLALEIGYLPDPLSGPARKPRDRARSEVGLPTDRRILGCIGVIDRRKGANFLIEAAGELPPNHQILLAGRFHPDIVDQIAEVDDMTRSKLILDNRFLDEEEMFAYICALDGMLMFQPGHTGISSFALHSINYGVPLLCSDTPWFRKLRGQFPEAVTVAEAGESLSMAVHKWLPRCGELLATPRDFSILYSRPAFSKELTVALADR